MDMEAQVLEIIQDILSSPYNARLSIKDITRLFIDRHGMDYERKITTKWIGNIIRKRLNLKTQKTHGLYIIPSLEMPKLDRLFEKYGVIANGVKEENAEEDYHYEPIG
jgi:hypothetical protein